MAVVDQGVAMSGFTQLNRALRRIEGEGVGDFGIAYQVQRRLRVIGEQVAKTAPQYVTHNTNRATVKPGNPRLEDSVRVSVTMKAAAVYSTAPHGGAQNVGAYPKRGRAARGPHIQARKASKWMNKAVAANREFVRRETDGLLDWLITEFEAG